MVEMQMEAMVVTPMAVTFAKGKMYLLKGPSISKEVFSLFFHSRENIVQYIWSQAEGR